jgi:transposase
MAISPPDARLLSDEVLEALRVRAVHGCALGYTEAQVAELLGLARETVSRWVAAYHAGGRDALPHQRTGRPIGSGRLLSDQQAQHLQQLLDRRSPEDLGIAAPLWSRRAVRELIRQEYGITLAVRTVGAYLRRWGYTAKRPRRHRRDQEPDEVRDWLEGVYPLIAAQAAAEGATIYWCDETGVAADEHPGVGYARQGQAATVEVPDSHIRVNTISAISNDGAVRLMTYTQAMTAALFLTFLERLLRSTPGNLFVIVDWLRAHEAKAVDAWVEAHRERLALFYLPRYAPELNADEYLNNDLKGKVNAAGLPRSKPELRSRIQAFMQRLHHLPEHVKSYFQHPCIQYAAAL